MNSKERNVFKNINIFSFKYKKNQKPIVFLIIIIFFYIQKLFNKKIIKVGFFCDSIKNGGIERVISLLLNYLSKEKKFSLYLITRQYILEGEYQIPDNIHRLSLKEKKISLFEAIKTTKLNILIYNFYNSSEINKLIHLKTTKIIVYDHSSFLYWIYQNKVKFNETIYYEYKKCEYVISLIPLENDYLFKLWGINSILMDNPTTFEYDSVIPSDLSNNNIIMMGRAIDPIKRYELGIMAMQSIVKEIPNCEMNIISFPEKKFEILIKNLTLENKVRFVGYQKNVEKYLKNSSLHILPSLSEAYPMVLSETKIFGIPSIICGLDNLALSKGGTVIIYDDNPITIAKEAIKILKDFSFRKKLGKEARNSMKTRKNIVITKKWVKLLLSVYKGIKLSNIKIYDRHYKIKKGEADKILNNQLILIKKRKPNLDYLSLEKLKYFSIK